MDTIPCQVCGEQVDVNNIKGKDKILRMYCSRSCATTMNNVLYPKKDRTRLSISVPVKGNDGRYQECMECRDLLSLPHNALFCSSTCRENFWNRYKSTRLITSSARKKKTYRKKKCPECETLIHLTSSTCRKHRDYAKPYSNNPIDSWISGEWNGSAGPNCAHILSLHIRKYLLEQADFACVRCSFSEVHPVDGHPILEVHHIDGDATNHTIDNLEVLCPNCHSMTDNYGTRNTVSTRPR